MNKKDVYKQIGDKLNLDDEKLEKVSKILEETMVIGRKNKDTIIEKLVKELKISEKDANKIYNTAMEVISGGLLDKLKHPFKSTD